MVKLAGREKDIKLINMVRREEAKKMLEDLGAEHVVVTSKEGWEEELTELIEKLGITVAFDAIARDMTGTMMHLLPHNSATYVYGGLSGKHVANLHPIEMIYHQKKVEGFFLRTWLTQGGLVKTILRLRAGFKKTMPALVEGGWAETQFEDCRLEDTWDKMCQGGTSREKKLRIRF